ncbi:hypothetical protein, partial [Pseudoalteromonas luteoviolacea]
MQVLDAMSRIQESLFYRYQHVTGPGCVLVSIQFTDTAVNDIKIVKLLSKDEVGSTIQFDLDNHINEIKKGVEKANKELSGSLIIGAIEVVPSDYPRKAQAEFAAYKVACHVIKNAPN